MKDFNKLILERAQTMTFDELIEIIDYCLSYMDEQEKKVLNAYLIRKQKK